MADFHLELGEYVITQLNGVSVNQGSYNSDLVLTNKSVVVTNKTTFGRVRSFEKHALDQIPIIGGQAQVKIEKKDGYKWFVIQLKTGKQLQVKSTQREDYAGFGRQINMLLTGVDAAPPEFGQTTVDEIAKAFHGAVAAFSSKAMLNGAIGGEGKRVQAAAQAPRAVSQHCRGCKAPLSGYEGQSVICLYCDTEQNLEGAEWES